MVALTTVRASRRWARPPGRADGHQRRVRRWCCVSATAGRRRRPRAARWPRSSGADLSLVLDDLPEGESRRPGLRLYGGAHREPEDQVRVALPADEVADHVAAGGHLGDD